MRYPIDSPISDHAFGLWKDWSGGYLPWEFTGPKDEFLATRSTASLGVFLSASPIYDISGPDAVKFLNSVCVNRDFAKMKAGGSRHALLCNDKGQLLASGVILKRADGSFRTYWLAPAIVYFLITSGLDVKGEFREDEYFFQLDGPKSLEILERATGADLHDLKFAQNKTVQICGTDMTVFRLGMSGALAYELHGAEQDATAAYTQLREVLFEFGGKLQGARSYCTVNHTPGGYPNQFQHFWYPFMTSGPGLAEFYQRVGFPMRYLGSASDNEENFYVTPYDIGWGYLVDFEHGDFRGREALQAHAQAAPRTMVTLEWDADDVGAAFTSQFRGESVEPCEQIEHISCISDASFGSHIRGDYVLAGERRIGVATGKTYAFHERRMVSLASIDKAFAAEGTEVVVLWGTPGTPQRKIRATVARFPYYNGAFRNETFDVRNIPRLGE